MIMFVTVVKDRPGLLNLFDLKYSYSYTIYIRCRISSLPFTSVTVWYTS